MNSPPLPYDWVAVFALLGGLLFTNPEVSEALAPYATIFFSALIGVMWALSRMTNEPGVPNKRARGALFVVRIVGAAMIITLPLAVWVAPRLSIDHPRFLVAPIAGIIGAIGDDWKPFLIWCRDYILRLKSGTSS